MTRAKLLIEKFEGLEKFEGTGVASVVTKLYNSHRASNRGKFPVKLKNIVLENKELFDQIVPQEYLSNIKYNKPFTELVLPIKKPIEDTLKVLERAFGKFERDEDHNKVKYERFYDKDPTIELEVYPENGAYDRFFSITDRYNYFEKPLQPQDYKRKEKEVWKSPILVVNYRDWRESDYDPYSRRNGYVG